MNENNIEFLNKHKDILSFRDLAAGTVATYVSFMTSYIIWVEAQLPGKPLADVTWGGGLRTYVRYLRDVRGLTPPRTIYVHFSQLRDFYYYVLKRDWDRP